jgi:hypothetical protein
MGRGLPPMKCTATSRRTGEQCEQWAAVGGTTCYHHGSAATRAMKNAEVRVTLAQLMKDDPRPVGTVLLDALHSADALLQDARTKVTVGGDVTANDMSRFIEALERAAKLAKTVIDAGVAVKMVEARERDLDAEGQIVVDALLAVLDPLIDRLEVAPVSRAAWRTWALQTVVAKLHGVPGPAQPIQQAIESGDVFDAEVVGDDA